MGSADLPIHAFEHALAHLECQVVLPATWTNFFDLRGPMASGSSDHRRHPRFYARGKAVLEYRQTLPALPRDATVLLIYTGNVSRSGVEFYNVEQLYPCERLRMWIGERIRWIQVVRCRRHGKRCWEIGAAFVTGD